ncbi:flagellar biosynthesis repressor FlbT [Aestuariivirga sp.]|uniref:flagellar biosynthesis repressor FlbT n=1 Tax=Aestuariivirga sp. TaxID=2650926 RepID=UPI0025C23635|nr:flagellar biosynthesis repressor FlbT [Aestuariivirga sp.]MCA3554256.1 flagellar biosynthesis repressor FlbT [Aestuariivirga sp.]
MFIHLKRGEKLYVNGAVLRVDRRTSLEFLNDVTFLLENHVMQADEATTPVRQLYFVVQSMLMDPANAGMTAELYKHLSFRTRQATDDESVRQQIDLADQKVAEGRYFDALKQLRLSFAGGRKSEASEEAA